MSNLIPKTNDSNDFIYIPPSNGTTNTTTTTTTTPWFGIKEIGELRKFIVNSLSNTVADDHKPNSVAKIVAIDTGSSNIEEGGGINEASIKCLVLAFFQNNDQYSEKYEVTSEYKLNFSIPNPANVKTGYIDILITPKKISTISLQKQQEQHILIELKNISLAYLRDPNGNPPTSEDSKNYRRTYWEKLLTKWRTACANFDKLSNQPNPLEWIHIFYTKNTQTQLPEKNEYTIEKRDVALAKIQLDRYLETYKAKYTNIYCHGLLLMVIGGVPFFYWKDGLPPKPQLQSSPPLPPPPPLLSSASSSLYPTSPISSLLQYLPPFSSPQSQTPELSKVTESMYNMNLGSNRANSPNFSPYVRVNREKSMDNPTSLIPPYIMAVKDEEVDEDDYDDGGYFLKDIGYQRLQNTSSSED